MQQQHPDFDSIKQVSPYDMEFWSARDLAPLLGYVRWENFEFAIKRAMKACGQVRQGVDQHFAPTSKKSFRGKGAIVNISDYYLSKYAIHLILSHSDLKKQEVAKALAYFTFISLDTRYGYPNTIQQLQTFIPSEIITTKEQETIGEIVRAFKHLKIERQYKVKHFRVDLYLPEYRIVVECDEEGHRKYTKEEERIRQVYIEHQLNCKFIRFNPDATDFHIGDVINEIMMLISDRENF